MVGRVVRRQQRRFLGVAVTMTALSLSMVALAARPAGAGAPRGSPVLTVSHMPSTFVAQQITATQGWVWAIGTTAPTTLTDCDLAAVSARRMAWRLYRIPACATDITSGNGRVYLLTNRQQPSDNTREYHIEVFDPGSASARVLAPVVLTNIGSAVAHTDLSFGDGALWLYGYSSGRPEVVRISPDSGAVEETLTSVPAIGGVFPALAANTAGVWLGGGPGGPPDLQWVRPGATQGTTVYAGPASSSILWLSAVDGHVWAGVAEYSGMPVAVTTHLVALDTGGHVAVDSPEERTGIVPIVTTTGGGLWGLAPSPTCTGPESLVAIDPTTGNSHAVATLRASVSLCDGAAAAAQLASVGRDVFALIAGGSPGSGVLYRAAI